MGEISIEDFDSRMEVLFKVAKRDGVFKHLTERIVSETAIEELGLTRGQRMWRAQ